MSPRRPTAAPLPPQPWWRHALALASVAALATALYWPSLAGPFVYDDLNAVAQSTLIRQLTPLLRFVQFSTRPLTDFSYALNYAAGELQPHAYHVTSLGLHVANAMLLYLLALITLRLPALAPRYGAARQAIAWAAAALFAAHPLASETVAYIASRSEVLASFWYLLGVVGYALAVSGGGPGTRRIGAVLVPIASFAGLASKEIVATLPLALLLYDWLLVSSAGARRWRPRWGLFGLAALPLALGGAFLAVRAYTAPATLVDYASTGGIGFDRFGPLQYLMTQFGVVTHYLRLIVVPLGQTFDYDWPLMRTPLAVGVLVPLAVLIGLLAAAWRWRQAQPLLAFAIGWTLLVLTPTSSVMPIADLAVERRMYLPLAGLLLFAAAGLHELIGRLPIEWRRRPALSYGLAVGALLAALAPLTWQRAALWGDAVALHLDGVAKAPGNPRVRLNLGATYLNAGQSDLAYETLLEARRLYDERRSVHAFPRIGAFITYNLGAVMFARRDFAAAEPELTRSLELGGQYPPLRPLANMLLARIAAARSEWTVAAERMGEAIKYSDNPDWVVDRAQMLIRADNVIGARMVLRDLLTRKPGFARAQAVLDETGG